MGSNISLSFPSEAAQRTISEAKMMKLALIVAAMMAVAAASPLGFGLGAPLLGKVTHSPAEYTHIQPEVTGQQPENNYKSAPYPVEVRMPYQLPALQHPPAALRAESSVPRAVARPPLRHRLSAFFP